MKNPILSISSNINLNVSAKMKLYISQLISSGTSLELANREKPGSTLWTKVSAHMMADGLLACSLKFNY